MLAEHTWIADQTDLWLKPWDSQSTPVLQQYLQAATTGALRVVTELPLSAFSFPFLAFLPATITTVVNDISGSPGAIWWMTETTGAGLVLMLEGIPTNNSNSWRWLRRLIQGAIAFKDIVIHLNKKHNYFTHADNQYIIVQLMNIEESTTKERSWSPYSHLSHSSYCAFAHPFIFAFFNHFSCIM